ncbi:MAG: hypothetical protein KBC98_00315, partial [Candidatus Pacebacteria bacterium]|nr:hypothetical protein [Candidatus Paceibacterota bacterium]
MSFPRKSIFFIVSSLLLIGIYGVVVFADENSGGYTPGESLNPTCAPGDDDCLVLTGWQINGADNFVYNLVDRIGLHTASPSATLHILATQTLIPGTPAVPGTVGDTTYTGDGSSDAVIGGQYDGELEGCQILVAIADITPANGFAVDRFTWGYGGGVGCNGGNSGDPIEITPGIAQDVVDGITVTFDNGTGHAVLVMAPALYNYYSADITPGIPEIPDEYITGDDPFLITDESDNELFNITGSGEVVIKNTVDGPSTILSLVNFEDSTVFEVRANGSATLLGGLSMNGLAYLWPSVQAAADGYVLTNDGTGTLTWEEASGGDSLFTLDANDNLFDSRAGNGTMTGEDNIFLGTEAGDANDTGDNNFFVGYQSGYSMNASNNTFIGYQAGEGVSSVSNLNLLGYQAGGSATGANSSNFFGYQAGYSATDAQYSNFFGQQSGMGASVASYSNFMGRDSGTGATNASNSNFFGQSAGYYATGAEYSNFFGYTAGANAVTASASNFMGYLAGADATNAHDSNFFGTGAGNAAAQAFYSNFIGQSTGGSATNASYANFIGYHAGTSATNASHSNFFGSSAGEGATEAAQSNFFGQYAGISATAANDSNFLGRDAGYSADNANNSNFSGNSAGKDADNASSSNFLGASAGDSATNASYSNFFGSNSGYGAQDADHSNFIGSSAGFFATDALYSNFIGSSAGQAAAYSSYSNFIGYNAGFYDVGVAGSEYANNSIFIGTNAGYKAGDLGLDNSTAGYSSILIGDESSTGGFENSIAIGYGATNTISGEFLVDDDYDYFNFNGARYLMPSDNGDTNEVLTVTDADGTLSWEPVSGGSTLDGSYDFGGAGVGRTITADSGA